MSLVHLKVLPDHELARARQRPGRRVLQEDSPGAQGKRIHLVALLFREGVDLLKDAAEAQCLVHKGGIVWLARNDAFDGKRPGGLDRADGPGARLRRHVLGVNGKCYGNHARQAHAIVVPQGSCEGSRNVLLRVETGSGCSPGASERIKVATVAQRFAASNILSGHLASHGIIAAKEERAAAVA